MSEHDDKQRADAERQRQEQAEARAKAEADAKAKAPSSAEDEGEPTDGTDEEFGATTKEDATDVGAPMLPGSPGEPQGPEDAFGEGLKRGDYDGLVGTNQHAVSVPTEDGGEPVYAEDGETIVDVKPRSKMVSQNARVDEVGDDPGEKGGVTTTA